MSQPQQQSRVPRPRGPLPALARALGTREWLMRLAPLIIRIETVLRTLTGNRWSLVGIARLPSVQVTVPGRRSGVPRTTAMLAVPTRQGGPGSYIVTGSNWGREKTPAWVWNLGAAGTAQVHVGPRMQAMDVHRITDTERARAWADVTYYWPGYVMEQRLAPHRPFAMFVLSPRAGSAPLGRAA